ncbi:MAG: hypothetical protein ACPG9A_06515 [Paracoccaceae bacterium]
MNILHKAVLPFTACFGAVDAAANWRHSLGQRSRSLGQAYCPMFHGLIHGNMG